MGSLGGKGGRIVVGGLGTGGRDSFRGRGGPSGSGLGGKGGPEYRLFVDIAATSSSSL